VSNFNREYRLVIARKNSILNKIKNDRVFESGIKESFLDEERYSLVFTQHQMTADIDKRGDNGPAKIQLYNLSPDTVAQIKEEDTLYLYAGYKDQRQDLPLIFIGDISLVDTNRKGADLVTLLICSDSRDIRTNLRVSGTARPNTTYGDAIQDLLDLLAQNGLPTGQFHRDPIENILQPTILPITGGNREVSSVTNGKKYFAEVHPTTRNLINGRTYEGNALEELEKIVKEINYEYYISLGKLYVVPKRSLFGSVIKRDVIPLRKENLKSPIRTKKNSGGASLKQQGKGGITVHTSLDPRMKVTTTGIEIIDDERYKGEYDVAHVRHSLDYEGNNWDTFIYATNR
jgi:hypothetical protein